VIVLSEVLMPRKPWVVGVRATAAMPPALTVARSEAGVPMVGPIPGLWAAAAATDAARVVVACMSAPAEAVAIATGAPTLQTAASVATRAIRGILGMMHSSWMRTDRARVGDARLEALSVSETVVVQNDPACDRT
jgi:hypothetical protein